DPASVSSKEKSYISLFVKPFLKVKITLLAIGKTDHPDLISLIEEYVKRLQFYISFEMIILPDLKNSRNLSESLQKKAEGESILNAVIPSDFVVLLDEKGKSYSSESFA